MKTIPIESEGHWRALRAKHVGSSEIAALFGLSPYTTPFALWHDKAGSAALPEPDNGRVDWGKLLEPAIAKGVSAEERWQLEARPVYCTADDVEGMGCTVDFHIVDHERGPGLVECKNVDWLIWKHDWTETHAPPHIEIQVQHQFAVTGYPWGAIAVLVGGNDLHIYERTPHAETVARLKERVAEFWQSIRERHAPEPFGVAAELDTLRAIYSPPDPKERIDLTGSPAAFEAARMFAWARGEVAFHQKTAEDARAKLHALIGKAGEIVIPGFDIRRRKDGPIYRCEMLPGAEAPAEPAFESFL